MDKKERKMELNTADIERYLELHKKEIMEHLTSRLYIDHPQVIRFTNEPFEALINKVMKDVPFGIMIHFALANAVMYSYWCEE